MPEQTNNNHNSCNNIQSNEKYKILFFFKIQLTNLLEKKMHTNQGLIQSRLPSTMTAADIDGAVPVIPNYASKHRQIYNNR